VQGSEAVGTLGNVLKFIALAVAVTVAGPAYSGTIEESEVERMAARPGVSERQALQVLIERQWVEGEAAERGIVVSAHEVQAEYEQGFATRDELKAYLRETGQTTADVKATLRSELLIAEIRAQVAEPAARSVTPEQVKAYVDAHPQTTPPLRTVRLLTTDSRREAKAALRRLRRGATFAALGGTRDRFARADHPAGPAMFRAPLKRTVRHGVHVFRVIRETPARPLPRGEQEARAWEVLAGEAQQRALDAFAPAFVGKWRPRTTCAPRYGHHPDCAQPPSVQDTP
jgi:hypothetical protein